MASLKIVALLLGPQAAGAIVLDKPRQDAAQHHLSGGIVAPMAPMHFYRQDCGLDVSKSTKSENPGAGMDPSSIQPYTKVLKDGFFMVDCVADYMFVHGDKFGNNKASYQLGEVSNVSIVNYKAHVSAADQTAMDHETCFSFCRTVPDMTFFGITNGRECYCMPYYQAMSDDSSMCDAPCDGNPGMMCGGKSKSTIFGMHACSNTASQLSSTTSKMTEVDSEMMGLQGNVSAASTAMETAATDWQGKLSKAGVVGSSDLMQTAKVYAGDLEKESERAKTISATMATLKSGSDAMATADLETYESMKKAEGLMQDMEAATADGVAATTALQRMLAKAAPEAAAASTNASQQYYPVMYFVDKSAESFPSVCAGSAAEKPLVGSLDTCSQACDADVQECVGFSYFPPAAGTTQEGLCFLISELKSATYAAGCPAAAFLQRDASGPKAQCLAKLSRFEGTTLKPDPSGKCEQCLEKVTKLSGCWA